MKNIKTWLKLIAVFLIMYFISSSADFNSSQSVFLAIVITIIYDILSNQNKTEKQKAEFQPFNVRVLPNWYEILNDYKIVDKRGWEKINDKIHEIYKENNGKYNILRDGINFTVINYNLVYNNNHKTFVTEIDFRERITEATQDHLINGKKFMNFNPEFYIKWTTDGYEIGITTIDSLQKSYMAGDNKELIKIATIPFSEFWGYSGINLDEKQKNNRKEILKKEGWIEIDEQIDDILYTFPSHLKHKYFSVYHKEV